MDQLAEHHAHGSTTVKVAVGGLRQTGIPVIAEGQIQEVGIVPGSSGVTENAAGLVVGLAVGSRDVIDGVAQVVQTLNGQTLGSAAGKRSVVVVFLLDEAGEIHVQTVIEEILTPSDATLIGQVHRIVLALAVRGVIIDRATRILALRGLVADVAHDTGTQLDIERQGELCITREHVPDISRIAVARCIDGIRVVVERGRMDAIDRIRRVPGTPRAVRALPILVILQVDVTLSPLREVVKLVAIGRVTFTRSILGVAVGELVIQVDAEPGSRLEIGVGRKVTAISPGIRDDTGTGAIGEGHAGEQVLGTLGERDVGGIVPTRLEEVIQIEAVNPRISLQIMGAGRIVIKRRSNEHVGIVARTPVLIDAVVHLVRTVRILAFILAEEIIRAEGVDAGVGLGHTVTLAIDTVVTTAVEGLQMEMVVELLHRDGVAEVDAGLAGHGAAGGDDHSTVATLGAVQRGSSRALKDVDALDVVHVDGVLIGNGTIHDVDRFGTSAAVEAGRTTEDDGTGIEGRSGGGEETSTGNLTGQGLAEIGLAGDRQVFRIDLDRGVTDGLLFTSQTLGSHNDLVEGNSIRVEGHIVDSAGRKRNLSGHITHGTEDESPGGRNAEGIVAVGIRAGTGHRSLHHNRGKRNAFAGGRIGNSTTNGCALSKRYHSPEQGEQQN